MPMINLGSGVVEVKNVPYATLRSILFEKNYPAQLPDGVTRQAGNTVNWVEFGPAATGTGLTFTVNPNTVEQLWP